MLLKDLLEKRQSRTNKNKTHKYMISKSQKFCIDNFDDIVSKYNNTYHRTIKMKPVDANWGMYVDFNKETKKEGSQFKVGENFRI